MLAAIIAALKSIIDLRAKGRQDRKVGLETQKLEAEKAERESPLTKGTIEDVHRYDPKVRLITKRSYQPATPDRDYRRFAQPPSPLIWVRVVLGIIFFLFVLYTIIRLIVGFFQ